MIAWRHGMVGEVPGQGDPLIPQPSLTLPALRQAVAAVAPGRLPEMFTKMQEAFVRAGEEGSVTPIHMFYREWAVVVEIECSTANGRSSWRSSATQDWLVASTKQSGR
jgi:hypothetical protein